MAADASLDPRHSPPPAAEDPRSADADADAGPGTGADRNAGAFRAFRRMATAATDPRGLVQGLGWFSVGLGLAEMLMPRAIARATGLEGHETLLRFYGVRELTAGMALLRPGTDKGFWIGARILGDAVDAATLLYAMRPGNPGRGRALGAFVAVAPVIAADLVCAYQLRTGKRIFG